MGAEQLGECEGLARQAFDCLVMRQQLRGVGAKDGETAGLKPDNESAPLDMGSKLGGCALEDAPRGLELSG